MTALQFETPAALAPQMPANDASPITLAEEFRFLAAQCRAHVEAPRTADESRLFVAGLVTQLAVLGGLDAGNTASLLSEEARRCPPEELSDLIRLASTALRHGARICDGTIRRRKLPGTLFEGVAL